MQFINNLRGGAILLILLVHSVGTINQGNSIVVKSLEILLDNSTILFVMIAGYLFLFSTNNFNYIKYLKNKLSTVVVPYIIISIPAIIIYLTGLKSDHYYINMDWFHSLNLIYQYLYMMVTGVHLGPLWFIPMIVIFYLLSPIFIYLKNKKLLEFAFFVSLILALFTGRPTFSENNLIWIIYFLPSYLLGMVMMQRPSIYEVLKKYSLILLIIASAIYVAILVPVSLKSSINSSMDLLLKIFLSIILFALSKQYLFEKNRWLNMFARISFYLYFIHGYFTAVFKIIYFKFFAAEITGMLAVSISFTTITLLSIISFIFIKLILKDKSKIFIGI